MIEKLQFLKFCDDEKQKINLKQFDEQIYIFFKHLIIMKNTLLEKNDKLQCWFSLYVYYQLVAVHTSKEG